MSLKSKMRSLSGYRGKGTGKVFSARELSQVLGHRTAISRLVNAHELIPMGSGYYATPGIDPFVAQVHIVARYYPKAVISGISALVVHGLSDERLNQITVDILKNTSLRNRFIDTKRVAQSRLVGIVFLEYGGQKIRIYDIERSLCDAYRIDRGALFFKALKRYLKQHSPNPEKIVKYDKILGTRVLFALQQEFTGV